MQDKAVFAASLTYDGVSTHLSSPCPAAQGKEATRIFKRSSKTNINESSSSRHVLAALRGVAFQKCGEAAFFFVQGSVWLSSVCLLVPILRKGQWLQKGYKAIVLLCTLKRKGIASAVLCCSTSFMSYDNLDQGHPDYNHRVYPFIFHHIDLVMMKIRPR
jgi:hypothetical protein